jgi:hypothetical protein
MKSDEVCKSDFGRQCAVIRFLSEYGRRIGMEQIIYGKLVIKNTQNVVAVLYLINQNFDYSAIVMSKNFLKHIDLVYTLLVIDNHELETCRAFDLFPIIGVMDMGIISINDSGVEYYDIGE